MNATVYERLKEKIYNFACRCSGHTNETAKNLGFLDVFDIIMQNSESPAQRAFVNTLMVEMPSIRKRQILLDGMAKEYQDCDGWLSYVIKECE